MVNRETANRNRESVMTRVRAGLTTVKRERLYVQPDNY
jgi:hypothetical protein